MNTGILIPNADRVDPVSVATRAEDLGYDAVWLPELWGRSAPVGATRIADHTSEVTIGTAILNVYSRSPAVLAMTAASLDEASDGRFVLGLGTSTASAVEHLHGASFDRPVRRAHETIEIVRGLLSGRDTVGYDGELLQVEGAPALEADVPIYGAALGAANRRMVGRCCDGWIPHNVPFPELAAAVDTVASAARDADRDPDKIAVAPYVPTAVASDRDRAKDAIRGHVAYYVGSGAGYRRAVADRYPAVAETIADAWSAGDRDVARAAVTDEMVAEMGVAATPDQAGERFRSLVADAPVDHAILVVPSNAPELVDQTIAAVAP